MSRLNCSLPLTYSHGQQILGSTVPPPSAPTALSPVIEYPYHGSLAAASPSREQAAFIISHAIGSAGWLICLFHAPTVAEEVASFLDGGPASFERADSAWLAFYFALLVAGASLLSDQQRQALGLTRCE